MRGLARRLAAAAALALFLLPMFSLTGCSRLFGPDHNYLVGKGRRDITGPLSDVQMFGFVREGQTTAGLHFRLWSRAFIIADARSPKSRVALVTADLGSMPHEIQREVVDRLQKKYGKLYRLDNVILAATHTHSGPGGYWHYGTGSPLGGAFYQQQFDAIVEGIVASIVDAHESLEPADILIARGDLEGAGANRSMPAYLNNPEEERARYENDTDRAMTLLKFSGEEGDLGMINWFAVHPTSMTYNNRLISGDHKGIAAQEFESRWERRSSTGDGAAGFVAAFANSNCGDVTANLNLDNTGPGADEFESTHIIGDRQLEKARELFGSASEALSGPISSRQMYVDFSKLEVGDAFTHAGPQHTCASAYGYAFAAGSTEDGGGHPLFKEGMKERVAMIDGIASKMAGHTPSDEIRACHLPKIVLFSPGEMDPPGQAQILPLGIARVGQLVLVVHPGEITTMAGRRLRETVAAAFDTTPDWVVIAAYANDFCGYTTTNEEYQTQQYEGGHTLYGPWQLAGFQQEFDRLARSMVSGKELLPGPVAVDMRGQVQSTPLGTEFDVVPPGQKFGGVIEDALGPYNRGSQVRVSFWTGNPQNDFHNGGNTLTIERRVPDGWAALLTDRDWSTKFHWIAEALPAEEAAAVPASQAAAAPAASGDTAAAAAGEAPKAPAATPVSRAIITWDIPADVDSGVYRIVFHGAYKDKRDGQVKRFDAASLPFTVR